MHSYQHNIKTFNNATRFLTRVERSLYRDLIELYYDTEQPLQAVDFGRLCRQVMANSEEEKEALRYVLSEYFVLTGEVYTHNYCDEQIEKFHNAISAKAKAGMASAESKKQKAAQRINERTNKLKQANKDNLTEINTCLTDVTNHKPETNNQEPIKTSTNTHIPCSESIAPEQSPMACDLDLTNSQISDLTTSICLSLKSEGASMEKINRSDPRIKALLLKGATVDMFVGAYREAVGKAVKHPFPYSLSIIEGRITEAHDIAAKARASPISSNKQVALEQRNMNAVREALAEDGIV